MLLSAPCVALLGGRTATAACIGSATMPTAAMRTVTASVRRSVRRLPTPRGRGFSVLDSVGAVFGRGATPVPESAQALFSHIRGLHEKTLKPLNTRLLGPLEKLSDEQVPLPMVLVIGNFSSGKSTFINYMTGRAIQETGIAPTDDAFTVIAASANDVDADTDGPSLVGDPGLGFGGLRQFGSGLINHVRMKLRGGLNPALKGIILVDSPGMIDSPVDARQPISSPYYQGGHSPGPFISGIPPSLEPSGRGYDFAGTVRWFAERSDVILLLMDPQKPGSTGETLTILTSALLGYEYKTHIILNKADQFTTVHDFARAYGALCWNLSKVISRKDLPKIYTMCVPTTPSTQSVAPGASVTTSVASKPSAVVSAVSGGSAAREGEVGLPGARADLEASRAEIIEEVKRAPMRRVDNAITRLDYSARLLKLHARVMAQVRYQANLETAKVAGLTVVPAASIAALAAVMASFGALQFAVPLGISAVAAAGGGVWFGNRQLKQFADYYAEGTGLDEAFRRCVPAGDRDDFITQLWERVRPSLRSALAIKGATGIRGVPAVKNSELAALDKIIEVEVPALRTKASKAGALSGIASEDATQGLLPPPGAKVVPRVSG